MDRLKSLAEWMTERQLNVAALVDGSGLDRKIVEAIVHGHYTPSPQQRQRLATVLGLTAGDIAWGHGVSVEHIHGHGPQFGRSP